MDVETGKRHFQKRIDGARKFTDSPVKAGDKIYIMEPMGSVLAFAASDTYQLLGKTDLGEPSFATPAIAGDKIFFRTKSQIFAFGAQGDASQAAAKQ